MKLKPEIVFILSFLFFLSVLVIFYILGMLIRSYGKKGITTKDTSQVGFVVDTFHELVTKLKDKEKELEVLRQKAEDKATIIEGYNENILQSVPSGVISLDEALRVTKVNLSAEKILEIKRESTLGKHHADVLNKPITDLLNDKKIIERGEITYLTPSGRRIWLGLTLSPLKDREENIIGQILIFTDLTQLKALEAQMELRSRLSSLGEISAGIAHELRNPMAVIAGYTQLLSKKADPSLKPTVDAITTEINVMNRIISDFLSFAKPAELAISDVDLKKIIENCIVTLVRERNNIKVHLDIEDLPVIKGDDILLRQAFTNLIQNAVEAMPTGGDLTIKYATSNLLDVMVSDTGPGIAEDMADKIFLPFFTTKDRGTGLGLSLVQKIIVSHGGSISVDSSERGATFRIRLPLR
ncbi:MAG TPA: ATP-binding protein [Thermodesulfovibrionales bacterium]|nr:ATP-binding protein [Thermodesulfovibrionales bacterium]